MFFLFRMLDIDGDRKLNAVDLLTLKENMPEGSEVDILVNHFLSKNALVNSTAPRDDKKEEIQVNIDFDTFY